MSALPLNRRALGLALSRAANASVDDILAIARNTAAPGAPRIGLTGPPGAGKSSLGGRLALLRAQRRRVGMLAIDPSSPRSGGAILGDRIRIDELEGAGDLFVRSLASRSAADGLADNLPELLHVMEAAGFDEVLVETVGVGQAEHAARSLVDTLVLVLNPGTGDSIQAMKAGILELADLLVVTKADTPPAGPAVQSLRSVAPLWRTAPPIHPVSAVSGEGIGELVAAMLQRADSGLSSRQSAGHQPGIAGDGLEAAFERLWADLLRRFPASASLTREVQPSPAGSFTLRLVSIEGAFQLGVAAGALALMAGSAGLACRIEDQTDDRLTLIFTAA